MASKPKKRGPGRPPGSGRVLFTVTLPPELEAWARKTAERNGMSISGWLRSLVIRAKEMR